MFLQDELKHFLFDLLYFFRCLYDSTAVLEMEG